MGRYFKGILLIILMSGGWSACSQPPDKVHGLRIAFISDVHLSDIYASFDDSGYRGILNPKTQRMVNIRTMQSQLNSTRLFNENYFAFKAALDDVAKRNIRYVVLPGDFSDDGQPINIKGLEKILRSYTDKYDIKFFIINGNHDPVTPFMTEGGKPNFLGKDGKPQPIMSKEGLYQPRTQGEHPAIITKEVGQLGYEQIINMLSLNGLKPQPQYRYWSTPFADYLYENYSFEKAKKQAEFQQRQYIDSLGNQLPDISYLVEPVEGLWLLALDGNVYLPSANQQKGFTKAPLSSGGEYSNIVAYKKHLVTWAEKTAQEAKRRGKTLITFSHYPMIDFYDGAKENMKQLFGEKNLQLNRVPNEQIPQTFAMAGIKLHLAGHLHLNDTGIRTYNDSTFLVNIQIPSLAGYPPAYKILTILNQNVMEIETVRMDSVAAFDELFPLYEQEFAHLQASNQKVLWNKQILSSRTYRTFIDWHLKELVRLRFIPREWPEELKNFMLQSDAAALQSFAGVKTIPAGPKDWTGLEMIVDFYRLLNGSQLAREDIGSSRLSQYQGIIQAELSKTEIEKGLPFEFHQFIASFNKLLHDEPSGNFMIDMKKGQLVERK